MEINDSAAVIDGESMIELHLTITNQKKNKGNIFEEINDGDLVGVLFS